MFNSNIIVEKIRKAKELLEKRQTRFAFTQLPCSESVNKAIELITSKMQQAKITDLYPPFLPKTLTKFRHEHFLPLKKECHPKMSSNDEKIFQDGLKTLYDFVVYLDNQHFDNYLEQIRDPYIRKIFNDNYEFDKIDFKELNTEYKIHTEISNLTTSASEWLLQIERTQDLLERIQLYFDIKAPVIIEKLKKQGTESESLTWADSLSSTFRKICSFGLKKASKVIQSTLFSAVAPTAAMLTFAIIGGSATLPWKSDIDMRLMLAPLMAIALPFVCDNLASAIDKKDTIEMLEQWAITLEEVSSKISKFNEEIEETIFNCIQAKTIEEFKKEKINLEKYVASLKKSISSVTKFDAEKFEDMRERTEAYFKKYTQVADGEWTVVLPEEEHHQDILEKEINFLANLKK